MSIFAEQEEAKGDAEEEVYRYARGHFIPYRNYCFVYAARRLMTFVKVRQTQHVTSDTKQTNDCFFCLFFSDGNSSK